MSKSKTTRSSSKLDEPDAPKAMKVAALQKVFYIPEHMLMVESGKGELRVERYYHPGKDKPGFFVTDTKRGQVLEVIEFAEPRRSWLINSDVCSNGRIYMTTPIDVTFLALHYVHKCCAQKAMSLDSICAEDGDTTRFLHTFVSREQLCCVADAKVVAKSSDTEEDMVFYKYNSEKALAWLALKTRQVADALRKAGVHCGQSALSQNYQRSEKTPDESAKDIDYLRMASDIVGGYLSLALHEQLTQYLEIPAETQANSDETKAKAANKRKSLQIKDENENKKIRLDGEATAGLKDGSLLDESLENAESVTAKPTPLKERSLTAKEKALAKGAKGTKSIASFFKK